MPSKAERWSGRKLSVPTQGLVAAARPEIRVAARALPCAKACGRKCLAPYLQEVFNMVVELINAESGSSRVADQADVRLQPLLSDLAKLAAVAREQNLPINAQLARDSLAMLTRTYVPVPVEELAVQDTLLSESQPIKLRIYDPAPGQELPVCLYVHGGGHVAGSIEVYDPICRQLAVATQCVVVSVDYRLAPEHPYPAGLEDIVQVATHLLPRLRELGYAVKNDLTVAGDSAGGALAASLSALSLTQADLPVTRQVLIYPSLDYTLSQPSIRENAEGFLLETDKITWYFDCYFQQGEDRHDASPLFMGTAGLPPTLLFSAGYCPLRDEAYAYAAQLREAGVHVTHWNFPAQVHAFLNLHSLVPDACLQVYQRIAQFIHDSE